jgi:hypothetical protein
MRKSRQLRCIAAVLQTGAIKTAKLLEAGWNFSRTKFRA